VRYAVCVDLCPIRQAFALADVSPFITSLWPRLFEKSSKAPQLLDRAFFPYGAKLAGFD
jgi:hypothetical protein